MDNPTSNPASSSIIQAEATLQPRGKTGNKPKELVTAEFLGIPVGRDKKVVDPDEVEKLAGIGCKDSEIADWFGIKQDTLRYNFADQLTKGREHMKQSLRRAQLHLALGGNAVMLIWLGKNLLGQSDNPTDSDANSPLPWESTE
jgi:hypothetical protein